MPICFVIQPFDSGKFDKRFADVYEPSIKAAELEPYRVDRDLGVEVPIDAIEDGIRDAAICLADITTDNPNVWYELGFAFASGRPVVMVCSDERPGHKFPFDIQHRTILRYKSEAPQDFAKLALEITDRIKVLLSKKEVLRQLAETEQVAPTHGLTQPELIVLATLAGETSLPGTTSSLYLLKREAERSGLTPIGFSLALRRLLEKKFIDVRSEENDHGESYDAARLMDRGWTWIDSNESLFVLKKSPAKADEFDDNIPF